MYVWLLLFSLHVIPFFSFSSSSLLILLFVQQSTRVQNVASCLNIGANSLLNRLAQVKERMFLLSRSLPYAHRITMKNVASHAKIIIKLTHVFGGRELSSLTDHEVKTKRKQKTSLTEVATTARRQRRPSPPPLHVYKQVKVESGDKETLSDAENGDDGVDEYIRTPAEVELYAALYEASERAQ